MTAIAVTIAGSDSSGGAGIQADLKTFAALGVYGASVITALTAQNTQGVRAIHDVPADFVAAQIDAVFSDLDVDAVKIGMLSQRRDHRGGRRGPRRHPRREHRARSGDGGDVRRPAAGAAMRSRRLRKLLIPRALVVTPNLPEAAALTRRVGRAQTKREMRSAGARAARARRASGADQGRPRRAATKASICWSARATSLRLSRQRVDTRNTHGTGCTLSSAIAAGLAKGLDSRGRGARGQGLRHGRDRRRRPAARSATATGRCIIFMRWW